MTKCNRHNNSVWFSKQDFDRISILVHLSLRYAVYKINKNITPKSNYISKDYNEFNKIIPNTGIDQKKIKEQNKNIKVIDYGKLNESEKKLKNKLGIDKIKIIYFD